MNGTNRLYRSTSEAMLGGVAAGLANYFRVDPTIVRAAFVLLALFSGGTFLLVYVAFWLLLPTAGSTAGQAGDVVRENLDEIGARFRGGFSGRGAPNAPTNGQPYQAPSAQAQQGPVQQVQLQQLPPAGQAAPRRQGLTPQIIILIGVVFLLANMGFFRVFHLIQWSMWWPLLLVGLGVIMLTRRTA